MWRNLRTKEFLGSGMTVFGFVLGCFTILAVLFSVVVGVGGIL